MYEHLLNTKEAAEFLGIDEDRLKELVRKRIVPAYRIGGSYLRFRKDQLDIAKSAIRLPTAASGALYQNQTKEIKVEKIKDFLYFNDFYIMSIILIILAIVVIFAS